MASSAQWLAVRDGKQCAMATTLPCQTTFHRSQRDANHLSGTKRWIACVEPITFKVLRWSDILSRVVIRTHHALSCTDTRYFVRRDENCRARFAVATFVVSTWAMVHDVG
jgi:hypothetical protein